MLSLTLALHEKKNKKRNKIRKQLLSLQNLQGSIIVVEKNNSGYALKMPKKRTFPQKKLSANTFAFWR